MINKKRCSLSSKLKLAIALGFLFVALNALAQDTIWVRRLDMGSDEVAGGIACRGNDIAVAGYQYRTTSDWLVVKCNQQGETLWTRTFDTGLDDFASDASFDYEHNVFVTGYTFSYKKENSFNRRCGYFHINLNSLSKFTDTEDQTLNAITIKYDSTGEIKWQRIEKNKLGIGIATDSLGNCYVSGVHFTGYDFDFWLAKYDSSGETLWTRTLNFSLLDVGYRIAVDLNGNIIMAGYSGDGYINDFLTIKFTPNGDTLWTRRFDLNSDDEGIGITNDQENNVIVAGYTGDTTNYDYLVLKYDSSGNVIWSRIFDQNKHDQAFGIACDAKDNIFVTGMSGYSPYYDYLTVKYDSDGNALWTATYDYGNDDQGSDVTCDANDNPIVTGASMGFSYDFLTIKYQGEVGIEEPRFTQKALRNSPVLPHSSISGSDFIFYAPSSGYFHLELYDCNGIQQKKVYHGYLSQGTHRFLLKDLVSGVHFIKVDFPEGNSTVQKLVLIK